ncbi:hypothetical protein [Aquibacillus halophilus]|nr:hypothetical protein [Aquibacillus halophilus]
MKVLKEIFWILIIVLGLVIIPFQIVNAEYSLYQLPVHEDNIL